MSEMQLTVDGGSKPVGRVYDAVVEGRRLVALAQRIDRRDDARRFGNRARFYQP